MSNFIKIGNMYYNTNHIVSICYHPQGVYLKTVGTDLSIFPKDDIVYKGIKEFTNLIDKNNKNNTVDDSEQFNNESSKIWIGD